MRTWYCNTVLINVHKTTEDADDNDTLEVLFDLFPKHNTKMLLGDFNAKVLREQISRADTCICKLSLEVTKNNDLTPI